MACALGLGPTLLGRPATAQVITEPAPPPFPDPKKFARGFFAQGELGALVFVGPTAKYASAGPQFGVRLGYDVLRWLAVQAHVAGAISSATLPPPTLGQSFQSFLYALEARLTLQVRRVGLFTQVGGGAGQLTTNVLDLVGITRGNRFSAALVAGLGIDYHTLNRHFSLGVGADYVWLAHFSNTHAIEATAYLRYTH